jgi:hypothetical protein
MKRTLFSDTTLQQKWLRLAVFALLPLVILALIILAGGAAT